MALGGSFASGFAYFTMRKLGTQISPVVTTFYFGLFSLPAYLLTSVCMMERWEGPIDPKAALFCLGVGIFGWLAQEFVQKAVGMAPAA